VLAKLDVELPGLSGLDLQRQLAAHGIKIPIIFITGYGDIPMSVRAMKAGATEFLTKPFRDQDLLDAIQQALERDRAVHQHSREIADLRERFDALTSREREVMSLVVGSLLKQANRFRVGDQRNPGQNSSWPRHEQNGRPVSGRSGQDDR
jgi:FixJ family two-component response regulator